MADLEKVIKAVEDCVFHKNDCVDCDYDGCVFKHGDCRRDLLADALELLQEQRKTGHWQVLTMCANEGTYCSECHTKIFDFVHPPKKKLSRYCPHCGVKMDEHYDPWEDA